MSNQKSKLLSSLKKTLAVGLPVVALSGFVPTALTVDNALAESEGYTEVVADTLKAKLNQKVMAKQKAKLSK